MSKGQNQKQKLLYLAKILNENTDAEHCMTVQEMISALEAVGVTAERKSIYDDLAMLDDFGMGVEKVKGKSVGYFVSARTFELPELKLLVDAVQSSKFITRKKSGELIKKIESLASRHDAQKLARQVYVSNRIKTMNESIYYAVDNIHEAISQNKKITFKYFEWNEKKEKVFRHDGKRYSVSPWALAWDDENYYMVAFDSDADKIKHYRVDKMQSLAVADEPREGAERLGNFDLGTYSKKMFGMFGGVEELVTIRCKNSLAGVIVDRFGTDPAFRPADGDCFDVTVRVAVSPPFLTWVMNFGDGMKILSPDSVRSAITALAGKVLGNY